MTQLTLENWKEMIFPPSPAEDEWDMLLRIDKITRIDQLLDLQKQALKDEAVKIIEEDILTYIIRTEEEDDDINQITYVDGLRKAQDILRNL